MLYEIDRAKGPDLKRHTLPLDNTRVILGQRFPDIELSLADWENAGLRVGFRVHGLGRGYYNDEPYQDSETAEREYARIVDAVEKGKYILELHSDENDQNLWLRLMLDV